MDYFRAILISQEVSLRAYELCAEVLRYNPGDYHAWQHRRRCIDGLGIPTEVELSFINSVGLALEKNFQIWHHRRCIMEMHKRDFDKEKEYLSDIFCSDAKNYHAWSYRLWFIERFNLWEGELEFVESQLHEGQVTNNSLWSYRYFLIMKTQAFTQDLVARELAFTMDCLQRFNMRNEAAWVYLKGLLSQSKAEQEASQAGNVKRWFILDFPQVKEWI